MPAHAVNLASLPPLCHLVPGKRAGPTTSYAVTATMARETEIIPASPHRMNWPTLNHKGRLGSLSRPSQVWIDTW